MKKIVLLGDSIRQIGYGTKIMDYLPKDIELYQPEDNCRYGKYLLRMLFEQKDLIKGADVIHFNVGLWDTGAIFDDGLPFSSIEEYKIVLSRLADILLTYAKKVIFSTTTPIKIGQPHNTNERIVEFNKVAVETLAPKGIIINDLFSLINSNIPDYIRDDDCIHLTEKGIDIAARNVAEIIKKVL